MMLETVGYLAPEEVAGRDFSFEVSAELLAPYDDLTRVRSVVPYRKAYPFEARTFADVGADRLLTVARRSGDLCGYLLMSRAWNGYAQIDDLAVTVEARRGGLGTRFLDRAVAWARAEGLPGIRLETQSNNLAACHLYRRAGFRLAGHDELLYSALRPPSSEVALFWYLIF